jgi:hypothetical protein
MSTNENTEKLLRFVSEKFETGELDNDSLVQLIELAIAYLKIETIPNYAKRNELSYNGVKKHQKLQTLFNVNFVIDND